jgi:hypothetical protein
MHYGRALSAAAPRQIFHEIVSPGGTRYVGPADVETGSSDEDEVRNKARARKLGP